MGMAKPTPLISTMNLNMAMHVIYMSADDDGDSAFDAEYDYDVVEGDEGAAEVEDESEHDGDDLGTNYSASASGIDNDDAGNSMTMMTTKTLQC